MTSDRSMELRWQQETIRQWLNTTGIPSDARDGLLLMLTRVKEELSHKDQVEQKPSFSRFVPTGASDKI